MTPTEHEGTVAVDAAARKMYADYADRLRSQNVPDVAIAEFDHLAPTIRNQWREAALPLVWAALEALPDRRAAAWDQGYACGLGDYGKSDDETQAANPYRTVP